MIINDTLKYVFVSVPKCGSQTMFHVLPTYYGGHRFGGMHHNQIPNHAKSYFTFTVARDPYDRAVSLWWSTARYEDDEARKRDHYLMRGNCPDPDNLEIFIRWIPEARKNPRMAPSAPLLNTMTQQLAGIRLDMILRLESLSEHFKGLPFYREGVPDPFPARNTRPNKVYTASEAEKAAIREWCPDDFSIVSASVQ